ncbi:hypothetical protein B296_00014257 [Ensete ventricosum]|uniref:Uncharacterized protein n=1 Tax=Ensete ventricosum TaxID=4639 RepID=A0A427AD40_ENSVE|nr:hypothetical protein B296_00014257 [Ensete ventricosum]
MQQTAPLASSTKPAKSGKGPSGLCSPPNNLGRQHSPDRPPNSCTKRITGPTPQSSDRNCTQEDEKGVTDHRS